MDDRNKTTLIKILLLLVAFQFVAIGYLIYVNNKHSNSAKVELPESASSIQAKKDVLSRVDGMAKALVGDKRNYLSVDDIASEIRDAIKKKNIPRAYQLVDDSYRHGKISQWQFEPFSRLIKVVRTIKDDDYHDGLTYWIENNGGKEYALLLRAQYYKLLGWKIRGNGYSGDTPQLRMVLFHKYIDMAIDDVKMAIQISPENPYANELFLDILADTGASERLEAEFELAIKRHPHYVPLYQIRMRSLKPKWGGSVEKLYAFVDKYAKNEEVESPMRIIYLNLYDAILEEAGRKCRRNSSNARVRCVAEFMDNVVTGDLNKNIYDVFQALPNVNEWEYTLQVGLFLRRIVKYSGGERYVAMMHQLAAEALGSDNQHDTNEAANNNYMMDRVVGLRALREGNYESAKFFLLRALTDLSNIQPPDQEGHDYAKAMIFDNLSSAFFGLKEYGIALSYQYAAKALAGASRSSSYAHLECRLAFTLELYNEAVDACTSNYEMQGSIDSIYWRGRSYIELGQDDKAIDSYEIVANSMDGLRSTAAMGIEYIYYKRSDTDKMLETLNKYTFLYDDRFTKKRTIASAYNNRCYAKKLKGMYKEAMSDCQESLKYGNIPDAYEKIRELQELLKQQNNGV